VSDGGDEPRLLHVRSELGYTPDTHHSLRDEPEAVSADEQRRQTQSARLRERRRRLEALVTLRDALEAFASIVATDRVVLREVHVIRRGVERVSQQIPVR
jgi:hypothetical protein